MVKFTLNGRFLVQNITGVQRVAREILAQLDHLAGIGQIPAPRLLAPAKGSIIARPDLKTIQIERVGRLTGHAWEQLELPLYAGRDPLLCLGNTAPVLPLLMPHHKVVTMVHDLSYKYFPSAYNWKFRAFYNALMPLVLRFSSHVATVSQAEQNAIETHYPFLEGSPRLSYLQNGGIPDHRVKELQNAEMPKAEDRGYGLYVGSLTKRKNAHGVLQGAVDFLRAYPGMRFVVIGATGASFDGPSFSIPGEIGNRIEFWGQIDDAERVYAACAGARFMLFPSFYEASPLPPIEAMAFGCPVVASRIPSLSERCGGAAVYCEAEDPKSISAAIGNLMEDPERWRQVSAAGRSWAARFSWEGQARGLVSLCRKAAA
ncbi:glycosyltransferase family 4 protein [Leisingera aquaemixtae]|uniref:glycosyltransferase family 4 protein n=1 Tax=Leisingera aquaemixtae TaxID=1396826 RepID=UPI001C966919|nr:glycosyltransferase family 1 protein [Leisingera aquaemixtae]MBY6069071.1 glycosyltransferase family 4 protein [Leisingera aquaemixtae]